EAPDSDTTTEVGRLPPARATRSATSTASFSDSREAVPLPTASNSTPWVAHKVDKVCTAWLHWFWGWCGQTMLVSSTLPVESTTAHLTPLRYPGSNPSVARRPAGAASKTSRRAVAKTFIAP